MNYKIAPAIMALTLAGTHASLAQDSTCDRACLKAVADQVMTSIVQHQPTTLPMTQPYMATENLRPFQLKGMSLWRTVTAIDGTRHDVIDPQSGQIFFVAVLRETQGPAILKARIKVENHKIAEIETYISRDPADTGEHFNPTGIAKIPAFWWQTVAADKRATREQLATIGKAAFDTSIPVSYEPGCFHFEEGDKVGQAECAAPQDRPVDSKVRVPVIDVEQGIVVSIADVDGVLTSGGSFVPNSMMAAMRGSPPPNLPPRPTPLKEMAETMYVIQLSKVSAGKVQGTQAYMGGQGPGARSPWVK